MISVHVHIKDLPSGCVAAWMNAHPEMTQAYATNIANDIGREFAGKECEPPIYAAQVDVAIRFLEKPKHLDKIDSLKNVGGNAGEAK